MSNNEIAVIYFEQLSTFSTLQKLLEKVMIITKKIIFGGEFNLILIVSLMRLEEIQY